MQSEHWRSCTEIFGATVARPPSERAAFLDQHCGGGAVLRGKVEFESVPELLLDDADALIGQQLGRYRIEYDLRAPSESYRA